MSALDPDELLAEPRDLLALAGAALQVKLRRGVSTAYYALFHRLVEDESRAVAKEWARAQ